MSKSVSFSGALLAKLRATPVSGQGGFQSLVRDLQQKLETQNELELNNELRERIEHYAFDFGSGGYQTLLREVIAEIEQSDSHP